MTRIDLDAQDGHRRVLRRGLLVLSAALVITTACAVPALASEGLSGYTHTETTKQETKPTSSTTTPTTSTPAQEVKPSTSTAPSPATAPTQETAPATSSTTTATTASQSSSSTLPFTGLDLRWVVGFGVLMLAGGASIVLVQRRQRRRSR